MLYVINLNYIVLRQKKKIVHEKSEGYNKKGCKIQLFYQNVDKKYEGLWYRINKQTHTVWDLSVLCL